MNRYCEYCGKDIHDADVFCPYCGSNPVAIYYISSQDAKETSQNHKSVA